MTGERDSVREREEAMRHFEHVLRQKTNAIALRTERINLNPVGYLPFYGDGKGSKSYT
jgi:hypothetical protein